MRGQEIDILLVTSRRKSRWIIPGGVIEPNVSARKSAAMEALDEAGIRGDVHLPDPILRGIADGLFFLPMLELVDLDQPSLYESALPFAGKIWRLDVILLYHRG